MSIPTAEPTHQRALSRGCLRLAIVCALAAMVVSHRGAAPLALAQGSSAPAYRLIAHPGNPMATIDREYVARIFLKKVRKWPGGAAAEPVDLAQTSPVRQAFCAAVLQRSVEAVRNYWQQMIFSGRDLPPPELLSDEAVVTYVLNKPGAVGYVSPRAHLHGAKVLGVR